MGSKLKSLFHSAGLDDIQYGVYEGRWSTDPSPREIESEWQMLENDLKGLMSSAELADLKKHDQLSRKKGSRMIYVPTFYAWGRVSK